MPAGDRRHTGHGKKAAHRGGDGRCPHPADRCKGCQAGAQTHGAGRAHRAGRGYGRGGRLLPHGRRYGSPGLSQSRPLRLPRSRSRGKAGGGGHRYTAAPSGGRATRAHHSGVGEGLPSYTAPGLPQGHFWPDAGGGRLGQVHRGGVPGLRGSGQGGRRAGHPGDTRQPSAHACLQAHRGNLSAPAGRRRRSVSGGIGGAPLRGAQLPVAADGVWTGPWV